MKHDTHTINSRDVPKSVFNQCCKHCFCLRKVVDDTMESDVGITCIANESNQCEVLKTYGE